MSCVLACSAQAHLGRYKSLITRAEECSKGLGCAPLTHTTVPSTKERARGKEGGGRNAYVAGGRDRKAAEIMGDGRFPRLVAKYSARGMSKMASEAKAREIIFGGGEETSEEEDDDEITAAPPSTSLEETGFKSIDELWAQLQKTWESRGKKGVELLQVLEEINEWLDRGVITSEQFQELLVRTQTSGLRTGAPESQQKNVQGGSNVNSKSRTGSKPVRRPPSGTAKAAAAKEQQALATATAARAAEAEQAAREAKAAALVQRLFRGWRGREHFAWVVRETARQAREKQRLRLQAKEAKQRKQRAAAIGIQSAVRRHEAIRMRRELLGAATTMQAAARALAAKQQAERLREEVRLEAERRRRGRRAEEAIGGTRARRRLSSRRRRRRARR